MPTLTSILRRKTSPITENKKGISHHLMHLLYKKRIMPNKIMTSTVSSRINIIFGSLDNVTNKLDMAKARTIRK